ncbi:MAG: MBL fold metallo-hydrolase [Planctomycetota bacterium]|nr:MBL fold metallo-hydrolase [Planctomycetota bacterium]
MNSTVVWGRRCAAALMAIMALLLVGFPADRACVAGDPETPGDGEQKPGDAEKPKDEEKPKDAIKVTWHGHACFTIEAPDGTKIVTDPFGASVGYRLPDLQADIVLVTHDHADHNSASTVRGEPVLLKGKEGIGKRSIKGINIVGVDSLHYDKDADKERGYNTIYSFEIAGVRFCHLGDLGRKLTTKQKSEIGKADVLMIPVGGKVTLDSAAVESMISLFSPRIVLPMHYKTKVMKDEDWPLTTLDDFLKGKKPDLVIRKESNTAEVSKSTLPKRQEIWVLEYEEKRPK